MNISSSIICCLFSDDLSFGFLASNPISPVLLGTVSEVFCAEILVILLAVLPTNQIIGCFCRFLKCLF